MSCMVKGLLCSVDGCDGAATSRGWCQAHYMRWYTTGSIGTAPINRKPKGRTCEVDGCDRPHEGRGLCGTHLRRLRANGDVGPAQIAPRHPGRGACSVDGCQAPANGGRGWCNRHYLRWRKTGDPLTPTGRLPNWTGDDATYAAVHLRLRKQRGPVSLLPCTECGGAARHWAYDHADPNEKVSEQGLPYSTDLAHYQPMCITCHRRYDVQHLPKVLCAVDGCGGPQKAKGLCSRHYQSARNRRE